MVQLWAAIAAGAAAAALAEPGERAAVAATIEDRGVSRQRKQRCCNLLAKSDALIIIRPAHHLPTSTCPPAHLPICPCLAGHALPRIWTHYLLYDFVNSAWNGRRSCGGKVASDRESRSRGRSEPGLLKWRILPGIFGILCAICEQ